MSMQVKRTAVVSDLNMTAEDWELYDEQGADDAAKALNQTFMDSVNAGKDRREVESDMQKVMHQYADLGADDSEPYYHLQDLLDRAFGREQ